jgi:ATP-dependent DNA helicase RecQ
LIDQLERHFGFTGLRAGQREAIEAFAARRDVSVVMPTGGGKSLCYQLPAVVWAAEGRGPTLVVSPLIALMNDQVTALRARGIDAVALHSGMPFAEVDAGRKRLGEVALVYASPERLHNKRFQRAIERGGLAGVAIDEAHCISEWGHDFRPHYRKLDVVRQLWDVPILTATATATPRVVEEIITHLGQNDPVRVFTSFSRPNLRWSVEHLRGDKVRIERAAVLLREAGVPERGKAVVYVATRKKAKSVYEGLRKLGFAADYYHAGRKGTSRASVVQRFESGRRSVLVATTAFGMGIDQPDVRAVIHVQAPGSLEAYYQQAGRAGRDGLQATCALLYSPADAITQGRLRGPFPGALEGWRALEGYMSGGECRQQALVRWFTGEPGAACGTCDVCADGDAVRASVRTSRVETERNRQKRVARTRADVAVVLDAAQLDTIVAFVDQLAKPVGKRFVAMGLRGSRSKAAKRKKMEGNPSFGALAGVPELAIVRAVEGLLRDGRLAPRGKKYPTVWIPDKRVRPVGSSGTRSSRWRPKEGLEADLARLRRRESRRRKVKPYQVFDNATLAGICSARPATMADLEAVRGMGPTRIKRYGTVILELVARAPS